MAGPDFSAFADPVEPAKPSSSKLDFASQADGIPDPNQGDISRGFGTAWGQTPAILKGAVGLAGATAEKAFGEGGMSTAVKEWGLKGYEEGMRKLQPLQRENDDVTVAWKKATEGDVGAMVDWAQYALGYGLAQVGETLAIGLGGGIVAGAMSGGAAAAPGAIAGAIGKEATKGAIKGFVERTIAKRAAELGAGGMTAEEATKAATKSLARDIGAGSTLAAYNVIQEGGSIYPEAVEQAHKEGRELTGSDIARIYGSAAVAGASETIPDLLGLGVLAGRISPFKGAGRGARAAKGALGGGALEAGQEAFQTGAERFGAGQPLTGDEATKDYINAAAMAAVPGSVVGGGLGYLSKTSLDDKTPGSSEKPAPVVDATAPGSAHDISKTIDAVTSAPTIEAAIAAADVLSEPEAKPDGTPAPAKGMVRYYHGGSPESVDGSLWFTSDLNDAKGWASRGKGMKLWYVDVPEGDPVRGGDPSYGVLPPARIELPAAIASKRNVLQDSLARPPDPLAGLPDMGGTYERTLGNISLDADRTRQEQQRQDDLARLARESKLPAAEYDAAVTSKSGIEEFEQVPGQMAQAFQKARGAGTTSTDVNGFVNAASPGVAGPSTVDSEIERLAHEAATSPQNDRKEPTDAQKEAGNYKKGHVVIGGIDTSIENPADSIRRAKKDDPEQWQVKMDVHYGYVRGRVARAPDGEEVDIAWKRGTPKDWKGDVFVVDQNKGDGQFDEPKVMGGFDSLAEAREAYLSMFSDDGRKRLRNITRMPHVVFDAKLDQPDAFMQPQPAQKLMGKPLNTVPVDMLQKLAANGRSKAAQDELERRTLSARREEQADADVVQREGQGTVSAVDVAAPDGGARAGISPVARGDVGELPRPAGAVAEPASDGATAGQAGDIREARGNGPALPADRSGSGGGNASPGARARNSGERTPSQKFLNLVASFGGVRADAALDITGDRNLVKNFGGMVGRVFRRGGRGLDEIATLLHEQGWLTDADLNDVDGGVQRVRDMLREAANGQLEPVTEEDTRAAYEQARRDRAEREEAEALANTQIEQVGPEWSTMTDAERETELDGLFGADTREGQGAITGGAEESARPGESQAEQEVPAEAGEVTLTGETAADLTPGAAAARAEQTQQAEEKAIADRERDQFALQPQTAPDEPAAPSSTGDMFGVTAADAQRPRPAGSDVPVGGLFAEPPTESGYKQPQDDAPAPEPKAEAAPKPKKTRARALPPLAKKNRKSALFPQDAPPEKPEDRGALDATPVDDAIAKARQDLNDALGDLGDIFGAGVRKNITAEQEQKLLPVLTRVMDAAFRLGYHSFKASARFVLDTIRDKLGADVADQITIDHLQGAYISMSGRFRDQGADTKQAVIAVESLEDLAPEPETANVPAVRQELYVIGPDGKRFPVDSLEDASRKWGRARDTRVGQGGGGASELGEGVRVVDQDGKDVARISYNGRVWPPGKWTPGQQPLLEAAGPVEGEFIPAEKPFDPNDPSTFAIPPRDEDERANDAQLANLLRAADTNGQEANDEHASAGEQSPEALGGTPAESDGGPQGEEGIRGGDARGSGRGTGDDQPADGERVPVPRGRGSRASGAHSAPRGGRGGRAKRGARGKGGAVSSGDASLRGVTPAEAPSVPAENFVITEDVRLGQGGEAEKFRDNLAAITTLKTLERENRRATPEEQKVLARYVGWGGLANAFRDRHAGDVKAGWEDRVEQLEQLLTPAELAAARSSTRNAHYTSQDVVRGMWEIAARLGFKGGIALETSAGSGNFLGLRPEQYRGSTRFIAVEYDAITARIATALYPQDTVLHSGFHKVPLADNSVDLNIGNPPFGKDKLRFQYKPELNGSTIHNQFFRAGLDAVKPGGLQILVVSRYLMDAQDRHDRIELARQARLVGIIRLPDSAFQENARTEVVTDIVILQKLTEAEQASMDKAIAASRQKPAAKAIDDADRKALAAQVPSWVETTEINDPLGGPAMTVNTYFAENPHMVIGQIERSGTMQFGGTDEEGNRIGQVNVKLRDGQTIERGLRDAIGYLPKDIMEQDHDAIAASLERHKTMSESLRIAISGKEAGHIERDADGKLSQLIERETPEGDFELTKREITPASPWSQQLQMDAAGRWFKVDVEKDAEGNSVKVLGEDGKPTKRNVIVRTTFEKEADVPAGLRLGQSGYDRLVKLADMRDLLVRQLTLEAENAETKEMEANRRKLAKAYKDFVDEHAHVNKPSNAALVSEMPDGALVLALELSYRKEQTEPGPLRPDGKKSKPKVVRAASAKPAAILRERVVVPYAPPGTAESPSDALAITLAESGKVDMERIAGLLGKSEEEAAATMQEGDKPLIFRDPETETWETANVYLSGQVKRKLNAARAAGLEANVKALEAVQPEQWTAEQVTVLLGSAWVPPDVYADFIKHLGVGAAAVRFSAVTNAYSVTAEGLTAKAKEWSTDDASVTTLVSDLLNSRSTRITSTDSDGKTHLLESETLVAQMKQREIVREFSDWVFADGERRGKLVDLFNEKFNTRVIRQHDGMHLKLPGKVPDSIIRMRRHQLNAIWRGISERTMLIDHVVGAGKTFTAIARAMERKRMGLSKKPTIVVPNHLVEQFAADVYRLYPGAKVLAAGKKDFDRKRRRKIFAKVATGDWDIVIMPHSSFGFIGIAPETETRFLEEELRIAHEAIQEAEEQAEEDGNTGWRKPFNVKEAERLADKIQARLDKVGSRTRDKLLTFEQMGIDDLTVDEVHEFKNLFYSSRLTNVRGMGDKAGSSKAFDLYNKVRVLAESPTGTFTGMSGTPISNSAVEMYTMMRYFAPNELKELGIEHFDAWRTQFVEATTKYEPTESGRLKEVNRLGRSWSNMRSLMDLYYGFTDAVTQEDIQRWYAEDNDGAEYPLPRVKGGERQSVVVKPTPAQTTLLQDILEGFDGLAGIDDPYERNAERLRLMDRARKLSLDARAVNPGLPTKEEGGKLEAISDQVKRIYDAWNDDRGTQLIFLDRSVPRSKGDDKVIKEYDAIIAERDEALRDGDEDAYRKQVDRLEKFDANEIDALRAAQGGGWNAYQQIKDNLVARGIPANEIRFVQEANNDVQKQALFDAVNDGEVRVLIGSTPRMGAGTNVQKRLVGLHHADVTWKPSDIEQREGRIIRQPAAGGDSLLDKYGVGKHEVEIIVYATERTVDAKMWDLNSGKLKMINGIRKYDGAFNMDFEDEDAVGMAEIAAIASGDPLLLERVKLQSELDKLELLRRGHSRKMYGIQDRIDTAERALRENPGRIEALAAQAEEFKAAIETMERTAAGRRATVNGEEFKSAFDANKAFLEERERQQAGDPKAKFSVTVDGKAYTSKDAGEKAISEALGDEAPFVYTLDGKEHGNRSAVALEIGRQGSAAGLDLEKGKSAGIDAGTWFGFHVRAIATRSESKAGYDLRLVLERGKGGETVVSVAGDWKEAPVFTTQYVRALLDNVENQLRSRANVSGDIAYMKQSMSAAERDLPELREAVKAPWPQQAEFDAANERLEEVVRQLTSGGPGGLEVSKELLEQTFDADELADMADAAGQEEWNDAAADWVIAAHKDWRKAGDTDNPLFARHQRIAEALEAARKKAIDGPEREILEQTARDVLSAEDLQLLDDAGTTLESVLDDVRDVYISKPAEAEGIYKSAREHLGEFGERIVAMMKRIVAALATFVLGVNLAIAPQGTVSTVHAKAMPTVQQERAVRRADFGAEQPSADAKQTADWIVDSRDNRNKPFIVVDKPAGMSYVFDGDGKLIGSAPALTGLTKGDVLTPEQKALAIAQATAKDRITPAGRFPVTGTSRASDEASYGKTFMWVDRDASIALHRVYLGSPRERRLDRLASPTAADNRISYGCINVPWDFYGKVIEPTFTGKDGIVYVMPDTLSAKDVFGSYDVDARAARTQQAMFHRRRRRGQTGTPEFKRWFGGSKVVDENGEPLMVYHGTAKDFSTFKGKAYFTPDASYANRFAEGYSRNGGNNVMPVYLSIQKPLDARELGHGDLTAPRLIQFLRRNDITSAAFERKINESFKANDVPPFWQLIRESPGLLNAMREEGFDGLIQHENIGRDVTTAYIPFEPTQIKSAIGNRGTFDPSNPDIRMSRNGRSRGMPAPMLRSLVDDITAKWENAPPVEVIETMDDAPAPIRELDALQRQGGAEGSPDAFWHQGKVYLLASEIGSERAAVTALFHEALGHYGLRGNFGNALEQILREVVVGRAADVRAKVEQYGLDWANQDDRLTAAEEVLAELAQARPQMGLVQRAIAAIRAFLRKMGVSLELSENDLVANFILPARGFVERGRAAEARGEAAMAFGREAPLWRSAMRDFIADKGPGSSPAKQWAVMLDSWAKQGKFKADELEWSGVKDWIALQEGKVSKDAVLDYLRQNGVQVTETVLGQDGGTTTRANQLKVELDALGYGVEDDMVADVYGVVRRSDHILFSDSENADTYDGTIQGLDALPADVRDKVLELGTILEYASDGVQPEGDTRYGRYTLPGGENYRELLLTLAKKPSTADRVETMTREELGQWYEQGVGYDPLADNPDMPTEELRDLVRGYAEEFGSQDAPNITGAFRSSHWDQPNIIAHVRFNERTDAEGKRVLFIEEIQSDWAQKGRREGFDPGKRDRWDALADKERFSLPMTLAERRELYDLDQIYNKDFKGPPAAPFVTKTDAWVSLAVKRMIAWAAENDFDRIAFVTGEQSAERYDLSKTVAKVSYTEDGNLYATTHDGDTPISEQAVPLEKLADYIGKEAAEKLMQQPLKQTAGTKRARTLSGLDLKVGGEGMRDFYDKIVPGVVRDVLKKVGGGKMGEVRIDSSDTSDQAKALGMLETARRHWIPQPGFDITPEMRAAAGRGMPMFNRPAAPQSPESGPMFHRAITPQVREEVANFLQSDRQFNRWWHSTVGTQLHKARVNREFATVFNEAQDFLGDVSRYANLAADQAPDLLPRVDSAADVLPKLLGGKPKKSPSKADVAKVAEALYEGTLYGGGSPLEGRTFTRDELKGKETFGKPLPVKFNLTDEQIDMYEHALGAVKVSLEEMGKSMIARHMRRHGLDINRELSFADVVASVDLLFDGAIEQRQETLGLITDPDYISDMAGNAFDAMGEGKEGERAARQVRDRLKRQAEQLEQEIEELEASRKAVHDIEGKTNALIEHGYFPAMRFGKYFVQVMQADALGVMKQTFFSLYETQHAANAARAAMARDPEYKDAQFNHGVMKQEGWKLYQGLSLDALELFADHVTGPDGSPIAKNPLVQEFLRAATNERSMLKRHIRRSGLEGYSKDAPRVLSHFILSSARLTSSSYHMPEMLKAAEGIKAGDVADEAIKLVKYLQEPKEEAAWIRGFMFFQYLGGSIASAVVNLTQPLMVTAPVLTQYTGYTNAMKQLVAAGVDFSRGGKLEGNLNDALKRAQDEGVVSPQEIHQLRAEAERPVGGSVRARKAMWAWGAMFSLAEQFNRGTTFIAAYRIGVEKKMRDPYAFASKVVQDTQFIYNKGSRPNWARGPIGSTVFTFKQFSISYIELAKRLYSTDKKAFAVLMLTLFVMAGLEGMPFAEDAEDVIDTIGQWMGFNTNSKKELRKFISRTLGPGMTEAVLNGVSGLPGVPIDVSQRMGMHNLIPGTGMAKQSTTDKSRDVLEFVGPAGSLYQSAADVAKFAAQGKVGQAVNAGLPLALQNVMKGLAMAQTGEYRDKEGRKVVDVTTGESIAKGIGFQPNKVARQSDALRIIQQDINLHKIREDGIADKWARAMVDKDAEGLAAAKQELKDWNVRNPESRITIEPQQIYRRVRELKRGRTERYLGSVPKEMRKAVREELKTP